MGGGAKGEGWGIGFGRGDDATDAFPGLQVAALLHHAERACERANGKFDPVAENSAVVPCSHVVIIRDFPPPPPLRAGGATLRSGWGDEWSCISQWTQNLDEK